MDDNVCFCRKVAKVVVVSLQYVSNTVKRTAEISFTILRPLRRFNTKYHCDLHTCGIKPRKVVYVGMSSFGDKPFVPNEFLGQFGVATRKVSIFFYMRAKSPFLLRGPNEKNT